jgi:hypothetical protein
MASYYHRLPNPDEQLLYDHFLARRSVESPEQLLERFLCLFIDGDTYPEPEIPTALSRIVCSKWARQEFKFILNRCCRILIHYWWFQPNLRWAIVELINLFDIPPHGIVITAAKQRLRQFVREFNQTEEFQSLHRLIQVVGETATPDDQKKSSFRDRNTDRHASENQEPEAKPLRELIHRYPYLYPYCLGEEISDSGHQTIQELQAENQRQFDWELSRYVTHLIQRSQAHPRSSGATRENPTLLSEAQLKLAIKQFAGKVDGANTCRDTARQFLVNIQGQSYRTFKEELYGYLKNSLELEKPGYGNHHFNHWLYTQLKNILPQSDNQPLSNFLLTQTCQQLLDALVASPKNSSNHLIFLDLINNVGATATIGLLLKILLLYNNLKSNLEKRFAVLFKHYEDFRHNVEWLVESLENLKVAFAIHFGSTKFPCMSEL